jgi:hypothetical protein
MKREIEDHPSGPDEPVSRRIFVTFRALSSELP